MKELQLSWLQGLKRKTKGLIANTVEFTDDPGTSSHDDCSKAYELDQLHTVMIEKLKTASLY